MKQLVGRLFHYLGRHKGLVAGVIGLGVMQAAIVKAPFLLISDVVERIMPASAAAVESMHNPLLAQLTAFREGLFTSIGLDSLADPANPAGIAALLVLLAVFGSVTIYTFRVLANLVTTRIIVDLRNDICSHLMGLSLRFFAKQRTGDLISTVSNDTARIQHSFTLVLENAFLEPMMIAGNMVLAWSVHPWLGLMVLAIAVILALPMAGFGRKVRKGSRRSLQALGAATDTMSQMFAGFRTVKAFQLERRQLDEFGKDNERFLDRTMRMVKAKSMSQALLYLIYMLGFAAILAGVTMVPKVELERIGISNLVLALTAIGTTYTHVKRTARTYNLLKESQGANDRLQVHFGERREIRDRAGAADLGSATGEVAFEDVSFAYEGEVVLDHVSFHVTAGQTVAFVGASGSGKSTILNLLTRFYDPTSGAIRIDGHDLRDLRLDSYLRQLATVDQQPFLFNASIRENILLGDPEAGEAAMLDAARVALVNEFVADLPDGYDTVVGERGSRLSGGQLQRITIARACIRDPHILLLDEATSALDTESERQVQQALDNLMKGRTSFLVAHRLSTIRNADRIYVIEKGKILEEGSHDELMGRPQGAYRRLRLMQA